MSHVSCITFHRHNLPADSGRQLFKSSKDAASVLGWMFFLIGVLDFGFFVSDVIDAVKRPFGQGHQSLDPNGKSQFFTLVFSGN